jgi:hypothetical protein
LAAWDFAKKSGQVEHMDTKHFGDIFLGIIVGAVTILFAGGFLVYDQFKDKSDYEHVTGELIAITQTFQGLPVNNKGKSRFLFLDNYPRPFEIFIGKDKGDFKPKFERADELKIGDEVTIFFSKKAFFR